MTASLIAAAVGAVAAAAGTGVLTARCARTPRMFLVVWTVAVFALAIALGAQTLGYLSGYTGLIFRCMEIGAQAIAPLGLCLGLVELIGQSGPSRFLMRLTVSAVGIVVLVILGTDPLGTTSALSTSWPDPTVFYQLIPVGLIKFVAGFTILTAVVSALVVLARSGRGREFALGVRPALIASAAAVLAAVPGIMMLAQVRLHASVFALTGALAAALTWLAGAAAGRRGLLDDRFEDDRDRGREYAGSGWYEPDDGRAYPRDRLDRLDRVDRREDHLGPPYQDEDLYRDRQAEPATRRLSDSDDDLRYPALAALAAERSDPAESIGDPLSRSRFDPEDRRGEPDGGVDATDRMFGQITIYTLLEDRLEEFDRMTERVVEEVRSREPGTLVYIVHAVPTAPMQRILYEVYRDRAAYDEHLAQPYVSRYVAARQSMVLATNAIELGLQQAKVTPLPSYSAISDILSESGIDLTGVTRSARGAGAFQGDQRRRSEPPDLPMDSRGEPHPDPLVDPRFGSRRYEPDHPDSDEPGYEDWAGLRDEDPWYR